MFDDTQRGHIISARWQWPPRFPLNLPLRLRCRYAERRNDVIDPGA